MTGDWQFLAISPHFLLARMSRTEKADRSRPEAEQKFSELEDLLLHFSPNWWILLPCILLVVKGLLFVVVFRLVSVTNGEESLPNEFRVVENLLLMVSGRCKTSGCYYICDLASVIMLEAILTFKQEQREEMCMKEKCQGGKVEGEGGKSVMFDTLCCVNSFCQQK